MIKTPSDVAKYDILTWSDFDDAVDKIANEFKDKKIQAIYGVPRGGLPLAVALSHQLNISVVTDMNLIKEMKKLGHNVLWIDDIVDTKKTLIESKKDFTHFTSWVSRVAIDDLYSVHISNKWVIMPWELLSQAEDDKNNYIRSRIETGYLEEC